MMGEPKRGGGPIIINLERDRAEDRSTHSHGSLKHDFSTFDKMSHRAKRDPVPIAKILVESSAKRGFENDRLGVFAERMILPAAHVARQMLENPLTSGSYFYFLLDLKTIHGFSPSAACFNLMSNDAHVSSYFLIHLS
jgi:hypothetical protein